MQLTGTQREQVDWFLGSYWVERFEQLDATTKVATLIPSVAAKFDWLFFDKRGEALEIPDVVDNIVKHARLTR